MRLFRVGRLSILAKSGHNLSLIYEEITKQGFEAIEEHDITAGVKRTLELLLGENIKRLGNTLRKAPQRTPMANQGYFQAVQEKWLKTNADRILRDSKAFTEQKKYHFMLLKAPGGYSLTTLFP